MGFLENRKYARLGKNISDCYAGLNPKIKSIIFKDGVEQATTAFMSLSVIRGKSGRIEDSSREEIAKILSIYIYNAFSLAIGKPIEEIAAYLHTEFSQYVPDDWCAKAMISFTSMNQKDPKFSALERNNISIIMDNIETLEDSNDVNGSKSIEADKKTADTDSEKSPLGYYFANRDEFVIYVMAEKPDNDIQWLIGDNYHELYQKGYELYEEGNFAEAVKVLNSSLAYNPVAIDARFELISCYFSLKEYEPALGTLRYLERYLGRKKDIAHYYRCLGYYYVEMNDYERAAAAYSMSLNYDRHRIALGELEGITRIHGIDPVKLDVKALLTSDGIPVLNPWYEESNSEIGTNKNTDIRCPACNRNLPADSIFCPFCGVKLEAGIE